MALSFDSTLTNAKGLSKIILFKGLSHPMVLEKLEYIHNNFLTNKLVIYTVVANQ